MPWEDYLGTQLPAGTRLPPNFKTFDFFDRTTGVASRAEPGTDHVFGDVL
ncbi:hypothetical protein [Pseudomonas fluorescens]|nr:hypothetical protein [Pseudomonas fluorescens]